MHLPRRASLIVARITYRKPERDLRLSLCIIIPIIFLAKELYSFWYGRLVSTGNPATSFTAKLESVYVERIE